jgi:hypothetical protein
MIGRAANRAADIIRFIHIDQGSCCVKAARGNPNESIGNPNRSKQTTGSTHATLAKLGISKDQSADWQKLAKVPDEKFEAALKDRDGIPSGRHIVRIGLHNLKARHDEKLRERGESVPSPLWAVRQFAKGLKEEQKWSVEQACFDAFIRSEIGKKFIDKVSEAMPTGLSMMACEKANTMQSILMEWFNINWTELLLPDVNELVKDFAAGTSSNDEMQ